MKPYIEETLKFIESAEMRDYLREHVDELNGVDYAKIVAYAPVPMEQKIPVFELIAEQSGYTDDYYNPAKLAAGSRRALAERYDNPPGTIFWLRLWSYHNEDYYFDHSLFTDFDAAVRFLKERQALIADDNAADHYSHSIEKHIPCGNGAMRKYCEWVLDHSGAIWYFAYGVRGHYEPEDWYDLWDYLGDELRYLPVPFKPGDIVLADCRPFAKERRVLIADIGDGLDRGYARCLFMLPNGKIDIAALQHNSFFSGTDEGSHISALYRAALWNGELTKEEAPLETVSKALYENPELGREIEHFVLEANLKIKDAEWGVTWEQLKTAFNL